jgi:hypothetical protein
MERQADIDLANEYTLYNFSVNVSRNAYVTPRSVTGEMGFHF